ncbi:hypothetical protein PG994_008438 [Apiospora phragmitis]|uniref:Uncharacterized protein n=1 Tax=Apiospora phragmitis TaxID=2905665 RepID=A0ABR1UGF8_9PEZI
MSVQSGKMNSDWYTEPDRATNMDPAWVSDTETELVTDKQTELFVNRRKTFFHPFARLPIKLRIYINPDRDILIIGQPWLEEYWETTAPRPFTGETVHTPGAAAPPTEAPGPHPKLDRVSQRLG